MTSSFLIPVAKATKMKKDCVLAIKHLQLKSIYILKQLQGLNKDGSNTT